MTSVDCALKLLRKYPRLRYNNISDLPRSIPPQNLHPISLLELQRLIDLNRINPLEPIDISTLCNTGLYRLITEENTNGFQLTSEGCDEFSSPVNIEVQYASEEVIGSIEKAGGVITTRFYDPFSVWAKSDPLKFFRLGIPIPKAKLPPKILIPFYANPESRGYLADTESIDKAKMCLAQKYGYHLQDFNSLCESMQNLMSIRKEPRQIFNGLQPGWLISIMDKIVFKPKCSTLSSYYES